jgi:hypothetical protein
MHTCVPGPVPVLGRLIHDLIKSRKDIVGKLHLGDRFHALTRSANREPHQSLLTQRRVEDPVRAKVCRKVHCASEDTPKLNVFPKYKHSLVCLQGMAECFVHGGVEVYAFCLSFAHVFWEFWVREGSTGSVVEERCRVVLYGAIEAGTGYCGGVPFGGTVLTAGMQRRFGTEKIA